MCMSEFFESFIIWIIFPFFVISICCYWYKKPKHFPSGYRGIPLLGNIPFFGKFPERNFKRWSKTYGEIISVRFGTNEMVVLNGYSSIKSIFSEFGRSCSENMVKSHFFLRKKHNFKNQFNSTASHRFTKVEQGFENKINMEALQIIQQFQKKLSESFDTSNIFCDVLSNVLHNVCFESDGCSFKKIYEAIIETVKDPKLNVKSALYFGSLKLKKFFDWKKHDEKLTTIAENLSTFLRDVIKNHVFESNNLGSSVVGSKNDSSLVGLFLSDTKPDTNNKVSSKEIIDFVCDLMETDTKITLATLNWAFVCLLHYPQTQVNLRKEINKVIGSEDTISWNKLVSMPYTQAFMEEVYRYRTAKPLVIQTACAKIVYGTKYEIPKGTLVTANIWAVHNDEKIWTDPDTFKPERFLNELGQFDPFKAQLVIPFSYGPKHCLGERLSRMEFFIFFVAILRKFEIVPDLGILPSLEQSLTDSVYSPMPFKIRAKELKQKND